MLQNMPFMRLLGARAVWLGPFVLIACLAPDDLPPRQAAMQGDSPELLPLSSILSQVADGPNTPRLTDPPDSRVAALRARAQQLRGPVIAPADRQHLMGTGERLR